MAKRRKASQSAELLAEFARLLNKVGPDDPQIDAFIESHKANKTFAQLAPMARVLKSGLVVPEIRWHRRKW